MGGISSAIAAFTEWLKPYAPFSWWLAFLIGVVIFLITVWMLALLRNAFIRGSVVNEWKRRVDTINPLDNEFTRQRVKISAIANPTSQSIANKRFMDCELFGPANIAFIENTTLDGVTFVNCDLIVADPSAHIKNVIGMINVKIYNGVIDGCTIFIPPKLVPKFEAMGMRFASFKPPADWPNR